MPHMFKNTPLTWFEQCSELYNVDSSHGTDDDAALPLQIRDTQPHAHVSWQQVRDQFNRAASVSEDSHDRTEHQAFVDIWTLYVINNTKAEK
jgi:hypothetical protein